MEQPESELQEHADVMLFHIRINEYYDSWCMIFGKQIRLHRLPVTCKEKVDCWTYQKLIVYSLIIWKYTAFLQLRFCMFEKY